METTSPENDLTEQENKGVTDFPSGKSSTGNDRESNIENDSDSSIESNGGKTAKKDTYEPRDRSSKSNRGVLTLSVYQFIAIILAVAALTGQIVFFIDRVKYKKIIEDQIPDYYASAMTVEAYLREYYIGKIDDGQLEHALAAAVLYSSGDAYAEYYTPEEYSEIISSFNGNETGIGVRVIHREELGVEVVGVIEGAPADTAGILKGDVITKVGGEDIKEISLDSITDMIRGEAATTVEITVQRGDSEITFNVERAEYINQTVESHMYLDGATAKKLGYIRVIEFTGVTFEQFKSATEELLSQGAEALVFDMRDNLGGTLDSVVEILDYLIPEGKIVRITDKNGNEVESYESDKEHIDLPMAVLTNGSTASAAELFTATLKDYGKAVSVGTKTFGKGTMQRFFTLPNGAAFKFSYRYYSPPISDNYDGKGIVPDITAEPPSDTPIYYLNDNTDTQLRAAAEHLTGERLN